MLLDQALPIHCCRGYCLVKVRSDITISLAVPVGNMKRILCSDWPILPALIPTSSRSIKTQKRELGQYPAILTSSLVDNAYFTARKNHQHLNSIEVIIDLQCTIFFVLLAEFAVLDQLLDLSRIFWKSKCTGSYVFSIYLQI